ncbi:MAG: hypothetical protein WAW42_15605 [Candidatus Competibacteraceae bacterium]
MSAALIQSYPANSVTFHSGDLDPAGQSHHVERVVADGSWFHC